MKDKDKLDAVKEVQKILSYLNASRELEKECRIELLELSKKYKLSIDFQNLQVTDWGDLQVK
jgi:hypothetical protein